MRPLTTAATIGIAGAWLLLVGVAIGAQEDPAAKKLKNPVPASPESVAAGQQLYQKFCRFCHGADAKGNGPMAHPSA